jgi:hypothetical protein
MTLTIGPLENDRGKSAARPTSTEANEDPSGFEGRNVIGKKRMQ